MSLNEHYEPNQKTTPYRSYFKLWRNDFTGHT